MVLEVYFLMLNFCFVIQKYREENQSGQNVTIKKKKVGGDKLKSVFDDRWGKAPKSGVYQ